jgi:hypothetical protein
MTNIRPAIANQGWPPLPIDSSRIRVPLRTALRQHHLDSFANVRLVHIDTNWFYQVLPAVRTAIASSSASAASITSPAIHATTPVYLSCTNGNTLPAGDWLYAQYLARQFLEGPAIPHPAASHMAPPSSAARAVQVAYAAAAIPDCCGAATECVLHPAKGANISNVSLLTSYDNEYKSINRLLPVYRVSFNRPDGIRIYVETTQDRFSFAMDNKRAVFDELFRLFHTWGWLDFLGQGRLAIVMALALLAFCTTLMGLYIFFTTNSKAVKGNDLVRSRRNHRYTAVVAALFTLMWTFSGAWQAFSEFRDDTRDQYFANDHFAAKDAILDYQKLQAAIHQRVTNISLVKIDGRSYWQVTARPPDASMRGNPATNNFAHDHRMTTQPKDLMKDGKAPLPNVVYIDVANDSILPDGDAKYAGSLATRFSQNPGSSIRSVTPVTSFTDEYNFTDKRLPVWKVSYASHHNERYYIETSTGRLSVRVDDKDLPEGYSFSVFHKHHFMDWGGKSIRDLSTMFWALVQVTMVTIGLILYFKYRKKRRSNKRPPLTAV